MSKIGKTVDYSFIAFLQSAGGKHTIDGIRQGIVIDTLNPLRIGMAMTNGCCVNKYLGEKEYRKRKNLAIPNGS